MARCFGTLVLGGLLGGLFASPALADPTRARFRVTVSVPASATVSVVGQTDALVVSEEDAARGFVVVPVRYRVTHNTRRGYLLQIAPRLGLASQVDVRGLGSGVVLREQPIELHRTGTDRVDDLALELRVSLEPGVRPGRYALPVELIAQAL